jgi:hypothetical protein
MATPDDPSDAALAERSPGEEPGASLTDADFRGCRWIKGPALPLRTGMFCGSAVAAGESWCADHRLVVFGAPLASG